MEWFAIFFSAVLIGISKTGIQGSGTLVVPILALVAGAKPSTGLILPMLCAADLMAVCYYRRTAEWKYIFRLLPYTLVGFAVALAVDALIPPQQFKRLLALSILIGFGILLYSEKKKENPEFLSAWWFAPLFGLLGGFSTMIGNAAGPIMAVYLLAMRLPKYAFVGTSAWFFLIVNYLKLPLQIWVWDNITPDTLLINLYSLPFIFAGAILGILLTKQLPEKSYRNVIIGLTLLSTLLLFV
ncbi:MAG: sulfite exporter TauE/SafE family protein [Bacteroidales bacterium]|nr:sulfite exporter TauE/SafE family protein [Bacteroidales bacterium]